VKGPTPAPTLTAVRGLARTEPPALPALGKRVVIRCSVGALLANLDGALFTFLFLSFVAPQERVEGYGGAGLDLAIFGAYFLVASVVTGKFIDVVVRRAMDWEIGRAHV